MADAIEEASKRRKAFIGDIVAVCKKHRVLLILSQRGFAEDEFIEHPGNAPGGYGFTADLLDIEESIRQEVFDLVHGLAKDEEE